MPKVPRAVLKDYFQTGDKPSQLQFGIMLDSMVNLVDDRDLIGLRQYNPSTDYLPGDCAVFNDQIVRCITATTGVFNPAHWAVMNTFGSVTYISAWDAETNVPELESSVGTKGFYYVVSNASSDPNDNTELDGIDDWKIGDWVIFNGSVWEKVDNSSAAPPAANVSYVPSGNLTATDVQGALDELEAEKQPLIALTPPFIPYAVSATQLSESVLSQVPNGVAINLEKVIRSAAAGEGQIDFGPAGDEVRLTTDGTTGEESRLLLAPENAQLVADTVIVRDTTETALLQMSNSDVVLCNDGGSGSDSALTLRPGQVNLSRVDYGALLISAGALGNGETVLSGGGSSVSLTSDAVSVNNNLAGSSVTLDADGNVQVESQRFVINTDTLHLPSLNPSTVPVVDAAKNLVSSTVTPGELGMLAGVTSAVQTQLDSKLDLEGGTLTGALVLNGNPTSALEATTKQYVDAVQFALLTNINSRVSRSGDVMTGSLVLNDDPTVALGAATKQYVDDGDVALLADIAERIERSGDTMTGELILSGDPTIALGAVTKQYADAINAALTSGIAGKVNKAGDTMSGALILNADPTAALGAATKQYADAINTALTSSIVGKVNKAGDTMSGALILNADPTAALGAATRQYVDAKVSKTGDTMTGALILNADPVAALGAATKQYADAITTSLSADIAGKVNKGGDTMTGALILNADPVVALGAATKQYADAVTASLAAAVVRKTGDTMSGALILNADPVAALGAATKQYADEINTALSADISGKVSKAGDTMTGALLLNADPVVSLGAATKRYVDGLNSSKLNKTGDTMTGDLILNANPTLALGAVTKQYVDAINTTLTSSIAAKVNKSGDTMTGALVLNADPSAALGAATKQYVDAATKKLIVPFSFTGEVITSSTAAAYTTIPIQVTIPAASAVFAGATTITARLTVDYLLESGTQQATGEIALTEWTSSITPAVISGSLLTLSSTPDVWTKLTTATPFTIGGNRTYRMLFRKTGGATGSRVRIEGGTLTLFFS